MFGGSLQLFVFAAVYSLSCASLPSDPYVTLGLSRSSSPHDVKRSYKALARQWHPDKNDSPEAAERFMEIKKAYEVLSDPLKKERFDKFGVVDDDKTQEGHQSHGFDSFFGGFGFGGFDSGTSFFSKHRISIRQYSFSILERSHQQPYLIFAYSGYCQLCFRLEPIWKSVVEDLEPLGYGIATVNAMHDGNLLDKLRVSRLPSIVALVEGRAIHFRGDFYRLSSRAVRIFARDVIPDSTILSINSYDKLRRFIDQSLSSNKAAVLVLGSGAQPRTRFLLSAMRLSRVTRFAYVSLSENTQDVENMKEAISIKCTECENVIVFNEFPEDGPVARLSSANGKLAKADLDKMLDANQFLLLPRIASWSYLDGLCPVSARSDRTLCVWLLAVSPSDPLLPSFRLFAKRHSSHLRKNNVRLAHISASTQQEFLRPFLEKRSQRIEESARDILVLWRLESNRARFSLLESGWEDSPGVASSLLSQLHQVQTLPLHHSAPLSSLLDEHAPSWFVAFSRRAMRLLQNAYFELSKEEAYPVMSAIFSFLVIVAIGMALSNVVGSGAAEKKKRPATRSAGEGEREPREGWHPEDPRAPPSEDDALRAASQRKMHKAMNVMRPLLHELRAESQFGMIRLLKPGCRSLILLVDKENKELLLEQFALAVYPLRNNKTFSFGFLMVEKNMAWFRKLLEHTLPLASTESSDGREASAPFMTQRLKSINAKQTVGTVLALCGWKLYFSIYHPMHSPNKPRHFLGFNHDSDSESDSPSNRDSDGEAATLVGTERMRRKLTVETVLACLPNWLDRLLEGSVRRYYIPEWPENLI